MDLSINEQKMKNDFNSMFIPAELHPSLKVYLTKGTPFNMLRHPLVFGVPYIPEMNNYYNQQYLRCREEIATAIKDQKIGTYIFLHERPYRLDAFCKYIAKVKVKGREYWEMLGDIWRDSENIWQNVDIWHQLLKSKRADRPYFMNERDRASLAKLPQQFTVYRGCTYDLNEKGMSWTLDQEKAKWFSTRFLKHTEIPLVPSKTVNKKNVFAYVTDRGEDEIILLHF